MKPAASSTGNNSFDEILFSLLGNFGGLPKSGMGVSPVSAGNRKDGRDARPTLSAPSEEVEKFVPRFTPVFLLSNRKLRSQRPPFNSSLDKIAKVLQLDCEIDVIYRHTAWNLQNDSRKIKNRLDTSFDQLIGGRLRAGARDR